MKTRTRAQAKLITAQLLSGAGIASGYAVGGLLAEEITGKTSMAGIAQMSVILGAGFIAYPLAVLAGRAGRRTALTLGFGIGTIGATVVLLGVALQFLPLFMLGMMMCGSATASGLQARYAAVDHRRSRECRAGHVAGRVGDDGRFRARAQLHGTGRAPRCGTGHERTGRAIPDLDDQQDRN